MNDFTSSDGVHVAVQAYVTDKGPAVWVGGHRLSPLDASALREFFRAEEDESLGRWRDPERDSFVVYPQGSAGIVVLCETTGISRMFADRDDVDGFRSSYLSPSAYAYFDAHPEPKPWGTPEAGEVWVLDVDHIGQNAYVAGDFSFLHADHSIPIVDPRITAGRRLWPEVSA